jgi:ankyrin repeat protein
MADGAVRMKRLMIILVLAVIVLLAATAIRSPKITPRPSTNSHASADTTEDVNESELGLSPDSDSALPALQKAAATGNTRQMTKLLKSGASISQPDRDGWTALHWAVDNNQLAAVRLLLERGADVNANFEGSHNYAGAPSDVMGPDRYLRDYKQAVETPLCAALARGRVNIAVVLVDHGAKVDSWRRDGRTPLMILAHWGRPKAVQFLLDKGANVSAVDKEGWTALHGAAQHDQNVCAEILLKNGANPNATSKKSMTMFGETHWTMWQYAAGSTPLHVSVTAMASQTPVQHHQKPTPEQIATVKVLIAGGADSLLKNSENMTPRDYATQGWDSSQLANILNGNIIDSYRVRK